MTKTLFELSAYMNHSCKQSSPATDPFSVSRGCLLTAASTVVLYISLKKKNVSPANLLSFPRKANFSGDCQWFCIKLNRLYRHLWSFSKVTHKDYLVKTHDLPPKITEHHKLSAICAILCCCRQCELSYITFPLKMGNEPWAHFHWPVQMPGYSRALTGVSKRCLCFAKKG